MPVEYVISGDIFDAKVEALVNPVNCVGVAGAGLAKRFRDVFPMNFADYAAACRRNEVRIGAIHAYFVGSDDPSGVKWIFNFPTKQHWHDDSCKEDIALGLVALVSEVKRRDVQSIAIPALGCGLGKLEWDDVQPMIDNAIGMMPGVNVMVFEPR